jgi:sec-independent protein translocase protein TatB
VFDIGTGELLALAVLALLVLGPEKLPRYAADAARFLRQLRNLANDARSEVTKELGPEFDGLNLRELNPRALMRKHLLDGLDDDDDDDADDTATQARPAPAPAPAPPPPPAPSQRPEPTASSSAVSYDDTT